MRLPYQVRHACLQPLLLIEEREHDRPDRRRGRRPVGRGNAQGWRKLAHGYSMKQRSAPVKPKGRPTVDR